MIPCTLIRHFHSRFCGCCDDMRKLGANNHPLCNYLKRPLTSNLIYLTISLIEPSIMEVPDVDEVTLHIPFRYTVHTYTSTMYEHTERGIRSLQPFS